LIFFATQGCWFLYCRLIICHAPRRVKTPQDGVPRRAEASIRARDCRWAS
jgi:hypothetical protein